MQGKHFQYKEPSFNNKLFSQHQKIIDELAKNTNKNNCGNIEKILTDIFVVQKRIILDKKLNPPTVVKDILVPRQELYLFIITNWIRYIFIPSLDRHLTENLLIFGIGRIFSSYNKTGVQATTDADLNFIVSNNLTPKDIKLLKDAVEKFRKIMLDKFLIAVEVDPAFTIRTEREVISKLTGGTPEHRLAALLFYKCNESSMCVLHDNPELREAIFSQARRYPDSFLFTQLLGNNPGKPTLIRLWADKTKLPIISDTTLEKELADSIIGSRSFKLKYHRLRVKGRHPDLYPNKWYFSIKYTANRVYDYVSTLLNLGYSLTEIGFDGKNDPDYIFLGRLHNFCLYLQEVIQKKSDSFNTGADYSYISSKRFGSFMEICGEEFRQIFEAMFIKSGLLLPTQSTQYSHLKLCIQKNSKARVIDDISKNVRYFIETYALKYEKIHEDNHNMRICIPYTEADLGFFVFDTLVDRVVSIVAKKFLPKLVDLGMKQNELLSYHEIFKLILNNGDQT